MRTTNTIDSYGQWGIHTDGNELKPMCISKWYAEMCRYPTKERMKEYLPQFCSYCPDRIKCELQGT